MTGYIENMEERKKKKLQMKTKTVLMVRGLR